MKEFVDYCRDFIKNNINEFLNKEVYPCDLGYSITDYINCDGTATYSTDKAKEYIKYWWDEASDYVNYEKDNIGEISNPFENPEAFMVRMIIWGVSCLLDQCTVIEENWNDEIVMTEEVINEICDEIDNYDIEY